MEINTIKSWYLSVLKKYTVFSGRASRTEYWTFMLVNFVISMGLGVLGEVVGQGFSGLMSGFGSLYSLFVLLPSFAVGVRRLHDVNKSGWWLLVGLIPFVGPLLLLFLAVQKSDAKKNDFGPQPSSKPVV